MRPVDAPERNDGRAASAALASALVAPRFTLFAGLWGWALLMHQATFDRWRHSPLGWMLCVLAAALVLRPSSLPLLAATIAVDAVYAFQCLPETANHLLFEGLVCLIWCAAFAVHAGKRLRAGAPLSRWLSLAPGEMHPLSATLVPLRYAFVLLYWLSVLHKLNYDFIAPDSSCASYMYRRVSELLPFMPRAPWAEHVAIWSTLLAEAALPVLLLFGRTWRLGLVAALAFHLTLGFDPTPGIYSFTGLLYALFVLLLPERFIGAAFGEIERLVQKLGLPTASALRLAGLATLLSIVAYGATRDDRWSFRAGFVFFLVWSTVVIAGYGFSLARSARAEPTEQRVPTFSLPAVWAWVLPCVVLLNGLNPYLGLRTQLSFSMFSNLRTEGGRSNHLFMPRLLSLGHYQEDLVEVLATSDPDLAQLQRHEQLIPYFEFRRMVSGAEDLSVSYRRNGAERTFECKGGVCNDAELAEPYSRLMGRLLYFRPVDKGPRMACRH